MKRCINIDWLEIFCIENRQMNELYFESCGYKVKSRDYGTPQYKSMFTIYENGEPFIEVRRDPYSLKINGGIFEVGACHLRLCNRFCYHINPIDKLRAFVAAHNYTYKSISRIDIACDFQYFDDGTKPQDFITKYMKGEISKVNQNRLSAHGCDFWSGRNINSLKWGSPTSPNNTKFYNKSLELQQSGEKKLYIRETWENAGLNANADVWRIEFSLSSQFQTLRNLKSGEILKKNLSAYDTPERLMQQFFIIYAKYFDFRLVRKNSQGEFIRKYDCERCTLLKYSATDINYKPIRNPTNEKSPTKTLKMLVSKLDDIRKDPKEYDVYREAADMLVSWFMVRFNHVYGQLKKEKIMELEKTMEQIRENEPQEEFKLTREKHVKTKGELQEEYNRRLTATQRYIRTLMQRYGIIEQPQECPF